MNIVSEEDDENTKEITPTLWPDEIHTDLFSEEVLKNSFRKRREQLKRYVEIEDGMASMREDEALNFYQEDMKIWVDPLDGTKSFSSGQTQICTTLIGKHNVRDSFRSIYQGSSTYWYYT